MQNKNKLKELREMHDLSLREMTIYTGISNAVLCYLENEVRPFRQEHIEILCAFFKVSSDYLMGKSEDGIIAHLEDDNGTEITISKLDYIKYLQSDLIQSEVIKLNEETLEISINKKKKIILPRYVVYRELKIDVSKLKTASNIISEIFNLCKTLSASQLTKVLNFIKDYILK